MNNANNLIKRANELILQYNIKDIESDSLFYGKAGIAFYCLYMHLIENDNRYLLKIKEILNILFDKKTIENSYIYSQNSFAEGLSGLGFLLLKLKKYDCIDDSFNQIIDTISETILDDCLKKINNYEFDFFYGSYGLLYFLLENGEYTQCEKIIKKLYDFAKKNQFYLYNNTDDTYTNGYNFGLAHGVAGLISILNKCLNYSIDSNLIRKFLDGLFESLEKFNKNVYKPEILRFTDNRYTYPSFFPYNIYVEDYSYDCILSSDILKNGISHYTNRIGWCNSDMGYSISYYRSGLLLGYAESKLNSRLIGNAQIKRLKFEETGIDSMYMCHGSCGVAQMFKRLYELDNNEHYHKSYLHWLEVTMKYLEDEVDSKNVNLGLISGWLLPVLILNEYSNNKYDLQWDDAFLLI